MYRFLGEEELWLNFALFFALFRTLVSYILIKDYKKLLKKKTKTSRKSNFKNLKLHLNIVDFLNFERSNLLSQREPFYFLFA